MEEIKFVAVEEVEMLGYHGFFEMKKYEKEHPLHMLHDYIMQYYGGLREDVLLLFCDESRRNKLYRCIGEGQEPGTRNEWYRRLVRLLQCNAEAKWYELYYSEEGGKTEGYRQYYMNQLAGYAEMGLSAELVDAVYRECSAAYLLEFKLRQLMRKAEMPDRKDNISEENETAVKVEVCTDADELSVQTELLTAVLRGQEQIRKMLEQTFKKSSEAIILEEAGKTGELEEVDEETTKEKESDPVIEGAEEQEPERHTEIRQEEPVMEKSKEKAFKIASLFQQIRLKRKSVQLRKLDPKQQIQELALLMKSKNYLPEDMQIVRNLMNQDVSLEFLYTIIAEETESVKLLQQMYEFISYRPATEEE